MQNNHCTFFYESDFSINKLNSNWEHYVHLPVNQYFQKPTYPGSADQNIPLSSTIFNRKLYP